MKNSKIEWTDHTFNPWEGCTKVSRGCLHCYAENRNARFGGGTAPNWGPGKPRRRTSAENWNQPVKWNALNFNLFFPNKITRVFCASLADWLDDEVPIEWFTDLLDLIRKTPNLDWQLLTKRPQNWNKRMLQALTFAESKADPVGDRPQKGGELIAFIVNWLDGKPPANMWAGTSVEDQPNADQRVPDVLKIPARVRFLSCEPLLGPVNLIEWISTPTGNFRTHKGRRQMELIPVDGIHWVICGGESGPGARPMNPTWARSLRDQCKAAGVQFFFKQFGEWAPLFDATVSGRYVFPDGEKVLSVGKKAAGRLLDGVEHNEFPEPK